MHVIYKCVGVGVGGGGVGAGVCVFVQTATVCTIYQNVMFPRTDLIIELLF